MSASFNCKCGERKKPLAERNWRVLKYRSHNSAFNGYTTTPSAYSTVICMNRDCCGCGRTKAAYVDELVALGKCSADVGAPKLTTCEKCQWLEIHELMGADLAGCKRTGLVVPHTSGTGEQTIFHRVPLSCPRPDSQVVKRPA